MNVHNQTRVVPPTNGRACRSVDRSVASGTVSCVVTLDRGPSSPSRGSGLVVRMHARMRTRMRMRPRRRVTRSTARRWTMATMRRERSAYARCREMRAFYVGRGAPMAIASGASVARLGTGTTGTGGGGDDDDDGDGDDDERRDGREMRDGKRRVKGRTSSEAVTEFVTYACATSEGGCALARRETTRGAAATTSRSRELARDDGDGEAMTAIAMDENARRVFCASRSGRVVRVDVVEGETGRRRRDASRRGRRTSRRRCWTCAWTPRGRCCARGARIDRRGCGISSAGTARTRFEGDTEAR